LCRGAGHPVVGRGGGGPSRGEWLGMVRISQLFRKMLKKREMNPSKSLGDNYDNYAKEDSFFRLLVMCPLPTDDSKLSQKVICFSLNYKFKRNICYTNLCLQTFQTGIPCFSSRGGYFKVSFFQVITEEYYCQWKFQGLSYSII
jgi:hypothetical protein